jgi:hypothetical protein
LQLHKPPAVSATTIQAQTETAPEKSKSVAIPPMMNKQLPRYKRCA